MQILIHIIVNTHIFFFFIDSLFLTVWICVSGQMFDHGYAGQQADLCYKRYTTVFWTFQVTLHHANVTPCFPPFFNQNSIQNKILRDYI